MKTELGHSGMDLEFGFHACDRGMMIAPPEM